MNTDGRRLITGRNAGVTRDGRSPGRVPLVKASAQSAGVDLPVVTVINSGMVKAPEISRAELRAVAAAIASRCLVERVVLFGSRARNAATDGSDVDLAVVLPENADVTACMQVIQRALWPRPFPVDVIPISASAWQNRRGYLVRQIADHGITLYERAP